MRFVADKRFDEGIIERFRQDDMEGGHDKFTDPNYRRLMFAVFSCWYVAAIVTRVRTLIAMLAAAPVSPVCWGMGIDKTLSVITSGFGTTLGSDGTVIGLGVMMGRLLEVSGAAERVSHGLYQMAGETP